MKKDMILYHFVPGVLFAGLLLLFAVSMSVSRTQPVILSVEPSRVSPGDLMVLKGKNFGITRGKSRVFMDNVSLTASFIESWADDSVHVRVPPVKSSGLVSVETTGGRSKGALYILSERVPGLASGAFLPGRPYLSGINNRSFHPGELIVLKGDKMGMLKRNGRILVNLTDSTSRGLIDVPDVENYLVVPEDHIYTWQDNGVSFFLPDAARSGSVYIQTSAGFSNPVKIEVLSKGNTRLGRTRTVTLQQNILISHIGALPGNSLALTIPLPEDRPGQHLAAAERNFEFSGPVYLMDELKSGDSITLTASYKIEVSSFAAELNSGDISGRYENRSMLESWLESSEELPAEDFRRTALAVVKRETNPYEIGKLLFDYVLWRMEPDLESPEQNPELWLQTRRGDSLGYASLLTSLLRSAEVPARVVSGIWIAPGAGTGIPHHWVELYLPDYGWFPADPSAADGLFGLYDETLENPGGWGVLDNGYVSFTRGLKRIPELKSNSRFSGAAAYARLNHFGEWIGNLDSCSITYEDLAIIP